MLPDLHIDFSRVRSGGLVLPPLSEFSIVYLIHTVKGFGIVDKAEIDVLLELSCFFHDTVDVGNLISGSSAFSKTSLNIREFMVHILLKPGLENFEHEISELKWTRMGEFNSDDHYIYYCRQECLRRNGVAIMVNKRVQNAVLGCNLKNDRMKKRMIE